ncbi:MAG TPA: hypothetical protein EYG86_07285 [Crocinitomicaceae bacterium]|nr:hypothetical protein [Crocinitomicaceae bacterium]
MGDVLLYRIPQKEMVELNGTFRKVTSFKRQEGFILTDFTKNEKFLFEESSSVAEYNFSQTKPLLASKEEYLTSANNFLQEIKDQGLGKAVFSRTKKITYDSNPKQLFEKLCERYPDAFVYLISSKHFGVWLGATPEKLLLVKEGNAETISLAGTKKMNEKSEWGEKELLEQEYVTKFIANKLDVAKVDEIIQHQKEELIAGPVKHLATKFSFKLNDATEEFLADLLHPTPAVSGFPQEEAMRLIAKHESHQRSLYAGMIGVLGENETQLFVNLRCAQLIDNQAYLYLGGGFTKDSVVEKEWQETENKAETLLKVFQNS